MAEQEEGSDRSSISTPIDYNFLLEKEKKIHVSAKRREMIKQHIIRKGMKKGVMDQQNLILRY